MGGATGAAVAAGAGALVVTGRRGVVTRGRVGEGAALGAGATTDGESAGATIGAVGATVGGAEGARVGAAGPCVGDGAATLVGSGVVTTTEVGADGDGPFTNSMPMGSIACAKAVVPEATTLSSPPCDELQPLKPMSAAAIIAAKYNDALDAALPVTAQVDLAARPVQKGAIRRHRPA